MRLIDANKIRYAWMYDDDGKHHDGITLESIVNNLPTIEAVPIVHAEWTRTGIADEWECSNCKSQMSLSDDTNGHPRYCPQCGATMNGKKAVQIKVEQDKSLLLKRISKDIANDALDNYICAGKSIRQWVETLKDYEDKMETLARITRNLENELERAEIEKGRTAIENPLQFQKADGYTVGISNALCMILHESKLYE